MSIDRNLFKVMLFLVWSYMCLIQGYHGDKALTAKGRVLIWFIGSISLLLVPV